MKDSFQEMLYREQMKINTLAILINSIEMCINKNYLESNDKDTLLSMYNYCCRENQDFLMIDLGAPAEQKFRRNYLEVINPDDFM